VCVKKDVYTSKETHQTDLYNFQLVSFHVLRESVGLFYREYSKNEKSPLHVI